MPGNPISGWTPGALLQNYRELSFGTYTFPLTFQEITRQSRVAVNRQKLPFNYGEYSSGYTTLSGRDIEISGAVGSGLIGSSNAKIITETDLENERSLLAGLMDQGAQQLYVRPDRYINAQLIDFDHRFMDGTSFRFADWVLKFYAGDPRYYSTNPISVNGGPYTDAVQHTLTINGLGNTKAWPTITITGACTRPFVAIAAPSGYIGMTFSKLTMTAGQTLTIYTDPRPETIQNPIIYSGSAAPGLSLLNPANDLANSLDSRYFFPFISPTPTASTLTVSSAVAGSYTVAVVYRDTWI